MRINICQKWRTPVDIYFNQVIFFTRHFFIFPNLFVILYEGIIISYFSKLVINIFYRTMIIRFYAWGYRKRWEIERQLIYLFVSSKWRMKGRLYFLRIREITGTKETFYSCIFSTRWDIMPLHILHNHLASHPLLY